VSTTHRKVIAATCTVHRGATGFTNIALTKRDRLIEFDPHVDRSCVIILDETQATELCEVLTEWLAE
jgi:hypothetical protein